MAYLVAIPLRVWLTVLDPDSSGQASLRFAVHRQRQWPSEPKRGMVYKVLIHVISVEDSGGHGTDGRPLFYLFHFNLGAQDADQAVAQALALREQGGALATDSLMIRAPARHSCSTEYWRPDRCSDEDDDDEADG
jgi:hypothetical protein